MKPFWDDEVAIWVDDQLEHAGPFPAQSCRAMGVEHKGELVAGFVFHNFDPRAMLIEVSGASIHPRWATRQVVREAMHYIFEICGCQMMFARQYIENEPARRGWLHLGADEVIVPRLLGRNTVGTLITLTDDQWYGSSFAKEKL